VAGSGDAYGSGLMEAASRPLRATLARSTRTLARSTRRPGTRVRGLDAVAALGLWAAFLAVSRVLVERLYDRGVDVHVGNPPLVGALDPHLGVGLAPAVALGAAAVAWAPSLARRLAWRGLVLAAGLASVAWALALAAADGLGAVAAPLLYPSDYLAEVQRAGDPLAFVSSFLDRAGQLTTHASVHPPGLIALLAALREVGLHGEWMLAAIVLGGAALAPAAALVAARELAGEAVARRAAPFVTLAPAAVWVATSADALFMGVAAAGVALMVVATGRSGRRGDATALGGGLVLGVALHLAYGVAPLGVVVLAVALARRRIRPLLVGALGVAAVAGAFALAGFWWLDGLERARELYRGGLSPSRPYATFLVVSVAALAVAVGPATAVGLARLRDRRLWPLPGAVLAAVAFADVSGLSKGETERIWLPFVPWLLVACAAIGGERAGRGWLAAQVALAIGLQAAIRSP
jgi:methylthioxylose transferase